MKKRNIEANSLIEIIGDSHVRYMGQLMKKLNPSRNTFVLGKPGATTEILCQRLNANTAHLTPDDVLLFMSGTNDLKKINGHITADYFKQQRQHLFSQAKHTNICIVAVPLRYDNEDYNEQINTYNAWLEEECKQHLIKFININDIMEKEDYAKDGLHFTEKGKLKLVTVLSQQANSIIQQHNASFL